MENLLFIAKGMPNKIKSAGDLRAYNMLRILKNNYDISVIANSADYGDNDVKGIGCEPHLTGDSFAKVKELIKNKKPKMIVISGWRVAQLLLDFIRGLTNEKIVIDTIDVEFLRIEREIKFKGGDVSNYHNIKNQELDIYIKSDAVIAASSQDEEGLLKNHDFRNIIQLPCLFQVNNVHKPYRVENAYTIANWIHTPNIDFTIYLCEKIIPKVDVKLYIVGKHTPDSIKKFASEKIIIHGAEYEIDKFLAKMNILLAPIFYGAGMNGKIGQALAYGIPVVTTTLGAKPYGLVHEVNAMIGDDDETFINSINRILSDDSLRIKLSLNGRELMSEYTNNFWKDSFLKEIEC